MLTFIKQTSIAASAATVFAFHEAPDAFARLQPPWQTTEIITPPSSLAVGTQVVLRTKIGPFWQTIVAEHVAYEPGKMFADRMIKGPFASWLHRHVVIPTGPQTCTLSDEIEYQLPLGPLGKLFGGGVARRQLDRLFAFRHDVTRRQCEASTPG